VLAEAAGITSGSWYAWPSTHVGHGLVAAGMLIMAAGHESNPLNYDALEALDGGRLGAGMRSRKEGDEAPAQLHTQTPWTQIWTAVQLAHRLRDVRSPATSIPLDRQ
jgi:hypothetical protein